MKRFLLIISLGIVCFSSCEQPTMLSINQTALSFDNNGGNQSVTLTANKLWTASSNQGWLRISPSSGEGNASISVSCEANSTYDTRTGTITITSEELTQTISVTQAEGLGLVVSQNEFNISNEAQTISVEVQANVQYTVDIDATCRDWIKQNSTKGLSSNTIMFDISKNDAYGGREGKITIKQTDGSLSGTITVVQYQADGLFIEGEKEYNLSYEKHTLDIKIKHNISFEVVIEDSCKDWISQIDTKSLEENQITLYVAENDSKQRIGKVIIQGKGIQNEIIISQEETKYVEFADEQFKLYCITQFDENNDGELSIVEARNVERIEVFTNNITSLKGIEAFSNLRILSCHPDFNSQSYNLGNGVIEFRKDGVIVEGGLTRLDVSKNDNLMEVYCYGNQLTELILNNLIERVFCYCNHLSAIDISSCPCLKYLNCEMNNLEALNVRHNRTLLELNCSTNQLSAIDISQNASLVNFSCNYNKITSLDVSQNAALEHLGCGYNKLLTIDVSNNHKLLSLICENNLLSSIDVSNNAALTRLSCQYNELSSIDVTNNTALQSLECSNNQIAALDISNNTALRILQCQWNQLTSLDVSNNVDLIWIICYTNHLSSLDISKNVALIELHCSSNNLSTLDCSNNPALTSCMCNGNQINSIDVSKNPLLERLWCNYNKLSFLDASNCLSLTSLHCDNNPQLKEIWLSSSHNITDFRYDSSVEVIKYK